MGTEALVLTEEAAEERGYSGDGPFTFGGAFPGEWSPGVPLRLDTLGFDSEDDALDALEASGAPLERTTVAPGEGFPLRFNHAASEDDVRSAEAEVETDTGSRDFDRIRTHAQANEAADALEISFDAGATVADKIAALKAVVGGGAIDTTTEEPQVLTEGNPPEPPELPTDEDAG